MNEYLERLPMLLLYAFCIYCLPVVLYRYCIRRQAMLKISAIKFVILYMFFAFLLSTIIRFVVFSYILEEKDFSAVQIPIIWGFIDYYMLITCSSRDVQRVNVNGFSKNTSYTESEKKDVFEKTPYDILEQCKQLRFHKKKLYKYLNSLIAYDNITTLQAMVLYQEFVQFEETEEEISETIAPVAATEKDSCNDLPVIKLKRQGWGWSVVALIVWLPYLFVNLGSITVGREQFVFFLILFTLSVLGFVFHLIFFTNSKRINNIPARKAAVYNLVAVSLALVGLVITCIDEWGPFVLFLIFVDYLLIVSCYIYHLNKYPATLTAVQKIREKEKAYQRIAKFYEYMQKGIISEEEYEKCKAHILSVIDE